MSTPVIIGKAEGASLAPPTDSRTIPIVHDLRGIASLMVAFFHMACCKAYLRDTPVELFTRFGDLGIYIFFVISGFVIPYALHGQRYELARFPRFLLRRIVRIDPPYLVSIAVIVGLGYLSSRAPGYAGQPFRLPSAAQLWSHVAYLNAFTGQPTLNIVFWTLAIEFQYYILIGILYPLLLRTDGVALFALPATALALTFIVPDSRLVVGYLPIFLLGIAAFQYRSLGISRRSFAVLLVMSTVARAVQGDLVVAAVSCATSLIIALYNGGLGHRVAFLGTISYSLYLLHVPIGGRVVNLGERVLDGFAGKLLVLLLAVAASIAASYVYCRLVELPSQRLAKRIRMGMLPAPLASKSAR